MLQLIAWESSILLWIQNNLRNDVLSPIVVFVTTLGNSGAIWIVISLILLIFKKTRRAGIMSLCALVLSVIIDNVILKNIIARTRPF